MKILNLLLTETTNKNPKPIKRPSTNLKFKDLNLWLDDLKTTHGDIKIIKSRKNRKIATNADKSKCFGHWNDQDQYGVSFFKPLPLYAVVHPKEKLFDK